MCLTLGEKRERERERERERGWGRGGEVRGSFFVFDFSFLLHLFLNIVSTSLKHISFLSFFLSFF